MEYDRIILELMNRVQILEEKMQKLELSENLSLKAAEGSRDSKKYRPLADAILAECADKVIFSFSEIEKILGFSLPPSARNHRAFWANTKSHSISLSWMTIGFETMDVDMENEKVTFIAKSNFGSITKEQEIMAFLHEKVFDPILNSADASVSLKRGVNLTIGRMNRLSAQKMIQYYWTAISSQNGARFSEGMHREGFTRFEDIRDEFAQRFNETWLKA